MRRVSQLSSQYLTLSNLIKVMDPMFVLLSSLFGVCREKERLKCETQQLSSLSALWNCDFFFNVFLLKSKHHLII